MSQNTKNKILDVAEQLFARQGFNDTSLRSITSEAEVNLASVNYHFGSKKTLIQAVLKQYLSQLMPAIDAELKSLMSQPQISVEQVFGCLVQPLLSLNKVKPEGTSLFLRLLGRGYNESQGHLRRFISEHYGQVLSSFMLAIKKSYPELPAVEVFWRLHFVLGTMVFTMASSDALTDIAKADYQQETDINQTISRIIRFVSFGFEAPQDR